VYGQVSGFGLAILLHLVQSIQYPDKEVKEVILLHRWDRWVRLIDFAHGIWPVGCRMRNMR
jgi:hypothetical protein